MYLSFNYISIKAWVSLIALIATILLKNFFMLLLFKILTFAFLVYFSFISLAVILSIYYYKFYPELIKKEFDLNNENIKVTINELYKCTHANSFTFPAGLILTLSILFFPGIYSIVWTCLFAMYYCFIFITIENHKNLLT